MMGLFIFGLLAGCVVGFFAHGAVQPAVALLAGAAGTFIVGWLFTQYAGPDLGLSGPCARELISQQVADPEACALDQQKTQDEFVALFAGGIAGAVLGAVIHSSKEGSGS